MARNVFTIRLVMLLVSLAYLTSCSVEVREPPKYVANEQLEKIEGKKEDVDRGTAAVDKFHELLNLGKSDELFDWIDAKSQLKQDPIAFSVRLSRIQRELGAVERSALQRTGVFKKSATLEVRLEYVTKFSKENDSRPRYELFFFELYPNGDTRLLEYINGIDNEKKY